MTLSDYPNSLRKKGAARVNELENVVLDNYALVRQVKDGLVGDYGLVDIIESARRCSLGLRQVGIDNGKLISALTKEVGEYPRTVAIIVSDGNGHMFCPTEETGRA